MWSCVPCALPQRRWVEVWLVPPGVQVEGEGVCVDTGNPAVEGRDVVSERSAGPELEEPRPAEQGPLVVEEE